MLFKKPVRWHIYFSGRVQFVGFRYTAAYAARRFGLTGWVTNLDDGRVEMEVQGDVTKIRKLIVEMKSHSHIRIEGMEITELPVIPSDKSFEVRGY
jgi:acylphosphatase